MCVIVFYIMKQSFFIDVSVVKVYIFYSVPYVALLL